MKLVFLLALFVIACSRPSSFESVSWKNGDDVRDLHFLNDIQGSLPETVTVQDEKIEYSQQTFAGITIENTFVKRINHDQGALKAVDARYKDNQKIFEKLPFDKFKISPDLKVKIKNEFPYLSRKDIETVEAVIDPDSKLVWRLVYFDRFRGPRALKLNENLKILSDTGVGISWFDQKVYLFPSGPKFSELKEVTLNDVSFSPALSNASYEITSEISVPFYQNPAPLKFSADDPRLDQVQAYFYVDQCLKWIKSSLGIHALLNLDVQLHVGHPEKTNAAFYYNGKIRLGEGDGIVYAKIPQDPSIVSHEVFHSLIDLLAHLPTQGEGGSLNEAFADFFTSQLLKKPELGDTAYVQGPYKRTLNNEKKWTDKTGGLYGDSLIVSGLLWQLSKSLPEEKILKVALKTLAHLNPASTFTSFNVELRESLKEILTVEENLKAQDILRARGFPQ